MTGLESETAGVRGAARPMRRGSRSVAWALALLGAISAGAQSVTAVPKLDMTRFLGVWYEVAWYPNKLEKHCVSDALTIYTVGDKKRRFAEVRSCKTEGDNIDTRNAVAKPQNKSGDGKLKVTYLWPFSKKEWVLAVGPEYEWALVGSPNRKFLWVLSRRTRMDAEVLAGIRAQAAGQGFDVGKLVAMPQRK